jgi:hypothetical protein
MSSLSDQVTALIQQAMDVGTKIGRLESQNTEFDPKKIVNNVAASSVLSAPAPTPKPSRHATEAADSNTEQPSKRRKGAPKKPVKKIKNIERMPAINEQLLTELLSSGELVAKKLMAEDTKWTIEFETVSSDVSPDANIPISNNSASIKQAYAILKAHPDLLSVEDRSAASTESRWFKLCALSLIVAIIRQQVWHKEEYDAQDLVITEAEVPHGVPKKPVSEDAAAPAAKKSEEHKVRNSKITAFYVWQGLINQNPTNVALLSQYALTDVSKIYAAKWTEGKANEGCATVSAKTRAFVEKLVPAEAWNQQRELYLAFIESTEAEKADKAE